MSKEEPIKILNQITSDNFKEKVFSNQKDKSQDPEFPPKPQDAICRICLSE